MEQLSVNQLGVENKWSGEGGHLCDTCEILAIPEMIESPEKKGVKFLLEAKEKL